MTEKGKEYLGDSVYCEANNGMVTLTTNNGLGPSNTIHLELDVLHALVLFAERNIGYHLRLNHHIEGLREYAHWKGGEQQVGTCGTTLKSAIKTAYHKYNVPYPEK